ncbi:hypothetical protein AVEN_11813-1 [Araneus ventricosus]|uniref:Uncharacterized protein n=1 Tax=Araneus ventricosus TaxID=182803 RepID=A0A4Y2STB4_ARAVE|nr:hypothetical protein AVEN_11813-1 [Araneus ventricosus]
MKKSRFPAMSLMVRKEFYRNKCMGWVAQPMSGFPDLATSAKRNMGSQKMARSSRVFLLGGEDAPRIMLDHSCDVMALPGKLYQESA